MRIWAAFFALLAAWQSPTLAQSSVPCIAMVGDLWGETPQAAAARTLDGTAFTSPQALANAVGDGAVIQGGSFAGWDFRRISLRNACFVESDLQGSVWDGVDAPGIGFIKADLTGSSMIGLRAPGILLRDARLTGVKASRADFSGGQFEGGWFEGGIDGWIIDGANLTGFAFACGITVPDGCPVDSGEKGISAKGANFTRARLSSYRKHGLDVFDMTGAVLDRTELSPAQLPSISGIALSGPIVLVGGDERVEISQADAAALIADAAAVASESQRPSFDCARASSATEILMCGKQARDLPLADRQLASLFARVRAVKPAIVATQKAWLRQRDACLQAEYPIDCLTTRYAERIGVLIGQLGEQNWLARGQSAVFIDDVLPLSAEFRSGPLFARIAPVMAGASMTTVVVTRQANGGYRVAGDAVGANAHTCSLGANAMRLDPGTGWYSLAQPGEARPARILRVIGEQLEVFGEGAPDGDTPESSLGYASCGMRARFGPMRRIHLQPEIEQKLIDSMNIER